MLERIIIGHGGVCVQNASEKTSYVLACKEKRMFNCDKHCIQSNDITLDVKVQNWIATCSNAKSPYGDKDIIQCRWIVKCCEGNKIISLDPSYMIYTSKKTMEWFKTQMDAYFDDYTVDATITSLKNSFQMVVEQKKSHPNNVTDAFIDDVNQKYKIELSSSLVFLRPICAVACPLSEEDSVTMDPIILQMQIHGARVIHKGDIKKPYHPALTHIIIKEFPQNISQQKDLRSLISSVSQFLTCDSVYIVKSSWIEACIQQMDIVHMRLKVDVWPEGTSMITPFIQKPKPVLPVNTKKPNNSRTPPTTKQPPKRKKEVLTPSTASPKPRAKKQKLEKQPPNKIVSPPSIPQRNQIRHSPKIKKKPIMKLEYDSNDELLPTTPVISRKNKKSARRRKNTTVKQEPPQDIISLVTPVKPRQTVLLSPSPNNNSPMMMLDLMMTPPTPKHKKRKTTIINPM
jgi:hypothetical protein